MKTTKRCKHCNDIFEARRSNHLYCNTSCKTKASYKRNEYKYVSGHYQKNKVVVELEGLSGVAVKTNIIESIKILENKIDRIHKEPIINSTSVTNAVMGSAAADAAVFAVKKIFAPNLLPATKGDILSLKNELNQLKKIIQNSSLKKTQLF
ncbi:hypothetical protein [Tenacibaculum piscium]|uniref:hypothetical protein n=1 Tax=Tenacibaculum piscium TaxID=1458515 RepID=UPI001EFBCD98|nr:hypothetical protein [Tenacibaculum piscium]MCG8182761.1 hypothetical protein [Tenacibaculum piscium]MCG8204153.1 hypothetical protein [Tenacibaculum piscium]